MKVLLLICALAQLLSGLRATDVKEARFIDENALKNILVLAQQTQGANAATSALQQQYPYLAQNERLTLQGERQTHYPVQPLNVEHTLLPQQTTNEQRAPATKPNKDTLSGVKPINVAHLTKSYPALTQAAQQALAGLQALAQQPKPNTVESALTNAQAKPPALLLISPKPVPTPKPQINNAAPEVKPTGFETTSLSNLFALTNPLANQLVATPSRPVPVQHYAPANAPSYIIINPTTYPSFHYYPITNSRLPSVVSNAADLVQPLVTAEEVPNLENMQLGKPTASVPALEIQPIPVSLGTNSAPTTGERVIVQTVLENLSKSEGQNDLQELLERDQLKRRLQEEVADFFFRNYNFNKK